MAIMTEAETKFYLKKLYDLGFTEDQLLNHKSLEPLTDEWYEMIVSTLAVYYDGFHKDERLMRIYNSF